MNELARAVAQRYRGAGRLAEGFARGKISGDPIYATVLQQLPRQGTLVDAGCGEGYLLALARAERPALRLHGVDHDERRVALARQALQGEGRLQLELGDLRSVALPRATVICCLDVLHYMPPLQQDATIGRLAAALEPGGLLILRDAESGAGLRSTVTRLSERIAVAVGRHKGEGVFLRPSEQLRAALEAQDLQVEVAPCQDGTPFANLVYLARRSLARAAP